MQLPQAWFAAWLPAGVGLVVAATILGLILRSAKGRRGELTKVVVELPDGSPWADWAKSESLWARPLGRDLYEIRNTPFHAPDLHFRDVVRAISEAPDGMPKFVEVVRESGHRTFRVLFDPGIAEGERHAMLVSLHRWRAFYENGDGQFFAVNVESGGDYQAVYDQLGAWEHEGKLVYDTGATGDGTRRSYLE